MKYRGGSVRDEKGVRGEECGKEKKKKMEKKKKKKKKKKKME